MTKVVELQAAGADAGHDGGVGDGSDGDTEFAGTEDEISVCRGAIYVRMDGVTRCNML